ncbi:hypothetical protein QWZ08_16305 [Ferruginibacter paludis]|uniref:hypothetical protein n=1 Tax=Ferruginibacter paludis TaxID=1310417 RepID=UPI0025B3DE23|nr:hypothetical protein [Ferruginibacter paludis]MDN3657213.1 hypothetical protein [Ferruginibacter paludis]
MKSTTFKRNAAQIYLSLVPFVVTFLAFTTGHVSYKIYLPIWIINACLMITAAWFLGAHVVKKNDTEKKHLAIVACLLLAPTLLTSIFGGMGAPPDTIKEWVITATEQQVRFSFLILSGILIGFGLILLRDKLTGTGGNFYAQLGSAAIIIALPLLVFNMSFWHSLALEAFKLKVASASEKVPDWFLAMRTLDWILTIVEFCLTYVAIIAFAAALRSANWFRKIPSRIYIIISSVAIICILLYPLYPGSTMFSGFPYYPFMIPAIPFFMLYFIGLNLLRNAGTDDQQLYAEIT